MAKPHKTTYQEFIESPTRKEQAQYKREYQQLLISEMQLAAKKNDQVSVRNLAKAVLAQ